jgi:hypothetical protein
MDWFRNLTGFAESSHDDTRRRLRVESGRLYSDALDRSYAIGTLETPSLRELRERAQAVGTPAPGPPRLSIVQGDVRTIHRAASSAGALFQVASQFNLLEMVAPDVRPEDGVTRYQIDHTQGPACAIAAGAATIYRNYFVPVGDQIGQTAQRQIDCLEDIGAALGNEGDRLWRMRNGYAECTPEGLREIANHLHRLDAHDRDTLRDRLRIGVHWNVEVTDAGAPVDHRVSQAFCSALPVGYDPCQAGADAWREFATLVLEGAYEATLWAAALNAAEFGSGVVFLTRLGGGAFGNPDTWIDAALRRALQCAANNALDIRIVSHGPPDRALQQLVAGFQACVAKSRW